MKRELKLKVLGSLIMASFLAPSLAFAYWLPPVNQFFPTGSTDTVLTIFIRIVQWMMLAIGFIAIMYIIFSGFQYITASGDEDKAEKARKNLTYAIAGLAIALIGYVILYTINQIVTGTPTYY